MSSRHIPFEEIVENLEIGEGDLLLIASDILMLSIEERRAKRRFDPSRFIDSFIRKLGPEGTLLFPSFCWDHQGGYDVRTAQPETGGLARIALERTDFSRTRHPIHSFVVTGKFQTELCRLDNESSFGVDSPFAFLHQHHAKMLIIGLDYQRSFTFVHYVEQLEEVPYRFMKFREVDYTDYSGSRKIKSFSFSTRPPGIYNDVNPIGKVLEQKGISKKKTINNVDFVLLDLNQAFDEIQKDIRYNKGKKLHARFFRKATKKVIRVAKQKGKKILRKIKNGNPILSKNR
ncbi:MAG: AAC(3) family N-acetyltransferase [SAR324 cluster bacterium]|nr:AAC(3) family N-acetyltransferase [SAR324 cluster bacterium]